ncbi:type III pantothenate kinase [Dokdonia pacifica]|uniref:Type III pantothenate kinase n=1 Tax=Dokdonia pacifica TaxID=1627892 RepID=A0A239DNH5_9FLAO|nr:type III pantothenate kinase [Dokdonia pacifica]GGG37174.1 type III pantothenate kinase [Dokdonia pacifica]SNS33671.1 type III pantothenate kinase [Dokdonia pacifica]
MQLIIDVGNTRVKAAIFDDDVMVAKKVMALPLFIENLGDFVADYPVKKAIISSVGRLSEEQARSVQLRFPTVVLSHNTPLPFVNDYSTPETLGVDRMALVAAFAKAYPGKNGLIIDAGTCITYDFINAEGHYKGGAISPGIRLRYNTLHNLTANLPLLETHMPEHIIGDSTEMAIHSGVMVGIVKEIDGIIDQYKHDFEVDTVILTGGDTETLSKRLKNSIFAHSNFLMEGLNYILRRTND